MAIERKPAQHLINILKDTRAHHPNFVLFLGAGASVTSGVASASAMIEQWRERHATCYPGKPNQWHGQPEEYSKLFESLYDQQSQRREFIESKVSKSFPSWGYIYLVNLVKNNVFNTVFTTNFDDLLNEACYLFSEDLRPIVCAHDSSIQYVRITSKRPKIIKLHGDFLFDNIKNTLRELETLEENMKLKFKQFASEFGFIFIGYSGRDKSVMDVVSTLARFPGNFPHGVYWCLRKGEEPNETVCELVKTQRFHIIEIDGFDEFCAECHKALEFALQEELQDPYACLTRKLNSLVDRVGAVQAMAKNSIIKEDIQMLADKLQPVDGKARYSSAGANASGPAVARSVPLILLAQAAEQREDYDLAANFAIRHVEEDRATPKGLEIAVRCALKATDSGLFPKAFSLVKRFLNDVVRNSKSDWTTEIALQLMKGGKFPEARELLETVFSVIESSPGAIPNYNFDFHWINVAQTYSHQKLPLPEKLREQLQKLRGPQKDPMTRFGACLVLGEEADALKILEGILDESNRTLLQSVPKWPIFDLISTEGKKRVVELCQRRLLEHGADAAKFGFDESGSSA